jgi:hypothetical protein
MVNVGTLQDYNLRMMTNGMNNGAKCENDDQTKQDLSNLTNDKHGSRPIA